MKKSGGLVLLIILSISVSAVHYELGCSDPDLDTGGKSCVEVDNCQSLSTANMYYLLNQSVVSNGTCFFLEASNIVIDLNEFTMTFGDSVPIIVPNSGFESGTDNWDFTNAPNVEVTSTFPEATGSWAPDEIENQVVKFPAETGSDVIYSEYIDVIQGEAYALSLMAYVYDDGAIDDYSNFEIGIEGGTGCTTTSGAWPTLTYWNCDKCTLIATTDQVRVKIARVSPTARDAFFDAVLVKPSDPESHNYPGEKGHHGVMSNTWNLHDIRVTNGRIIQGQGAGMLGKAVRLDGVNGEADHLEIITHGADVQGIVTNGGDYAKIHHNTITLNGKRTHFSHDPAQASSAIYISNSEYSQVYENNIVRSPGTGIGGNYFNYAPYSDIFNNTINIDSSSIHCYALGMPSYGKVYNNFVNNTRGGGISSDASVGTEVFNNYFEVRDGPQAERGWTTKGIWTRYSSGGFDIHDNIFIGYGGTDFPNPGEDSSLSLVRIGANDESVGPIKFYNNHVEAHTNFKGTDSKGVALDLNTDSYYDGGVSKHIYNNTFSSNHRLIVLGDLYGIAAKSLIENNTFIKASDADSTPGEDYVTIFNGFNGCRGIELTDNLMQGGANFDQIHFGNSISEWYGDIGHRDFNISWTLTTNIFDSVSPANNARVEIWDALSEKVVDSTVDAFVSTRLVEREYGGRGSYATLLTLQNHSPYTVNVTYEGETQSQVVTLHATTEINFTFVTSGCTLPLDEETCDCIDTEELLSTINAWYNGQLSISQLMENVRVWKVCSDE